jgi:hypothetical protein
MTSDRLVYKGKVLQTIKIQDRVMTDSNRLDNATKEAFLRLSTYCYQQLEGNLTLTQLKSLVDGILTYWRESIGVDIETFWTELKINNVEFERRDELQFALLKGRFRRVDIGMAVCPFLSAISAIYNELYSGSCSPCIT